jgi:hypothetical protein
MAQKEGRTRAEQGDALFLAGCMLYWAEGSKDRNRVEFTNSDPEMVRFFVRFLEDVLDLRDEQIRITCNLFADHLDKQARHRTVLARRRGASTSIAAQVDRQRVLEVQQEEAPESLPYGTVPREVARTRVVQAIYGGIQEIGGFTRDAWLE